MKKVNFIALMIVFAMAAPVWADNDQAGDMELLEYLGSFETSSGKAVDPLLFKQDSKKSKKKEGSVNQESRKQQKEKSELKERDYEK